jgi:hypothetical protein
MLRDVGKMMEIDGKCGKGMEIMERWEFGANVGSGLR